MLHTRYLIALLGLVAARPDYGLYTRQELELRDDCKNRALEMGDAMKKIGASVKPFEGKKIADVPRKKLQPVLDKIADVLENMEELKDDCKNLGKFVDDMEPKIRTMQSCMEGKMKCD